mgnify:FL=1
MHTLRLILASARAAILTIVFIVGITLWAELSVPLKDWLKSISGHHWTSKSILSMLLFIIALLLFYGLSRQWKDDDQKLKKTLALLIATATLGVIVIALFFTAHYFKVF